MYNQAVVNDFFKNKEYFQHLAAVLFVVFAFLFFAQKQFTLSVICLGLLLILAKLDTLKTLVLSLRGGLRAEFDRKIIENIEENKEIVTKEVYLSYREAEDKIIQKVMARYDLRKTSLEWELQRNGIRPDLVVYTKPSREAAEIYEIKLARNQSAIPTLIKSAVSQLEYFGSREPFAKLKLIIASSRDITVPPALIPENVSVEIMKL